MSLMGKREVSLPVLPEPDGEGGFYSRDLLIRYAQRAIAEDRRAVFSRAQSVTLAPESVSSLIMQQFKTGPKTTGAMVKLIPLMDSKKMSTYLTNLFKRGYLTREKTYVPSGQKYVWLWTAHPEKLRQWMEMTDQDPQEVPATVNIASLKW